jgi:hypothetical protein
MVKVACNATSVRYHVWIFRFRCQTIDSFILQTAKELFSCSIQRILTAIHAGVLIFGISEAFPVIATVLIHLISVNEHTLP